MSMTLEGSRSEEVDGTGARDRTRKREKENTQERIKRERRCLEEEANPAEGGGGRARSGTEKEGSFWLVI